VPIAPEPSEGLWDCAEIARLLLTPAV